MKENISIIVSVAQCVVVIVGAAIALAQLHQAKEIERSKLKNERIKLALEMAEYYKENILKKSIFIKILYKDLGISDILDTIDIYKMKEFDIYEFKANVGKEKMDEIENKMNSPELLLRIIEGALDETELNNDLKRVLEGNSFSMSSKVNKVGYEMTMELLNSVEYFSMFFFSKCAEEKAIYQSIHQTYLDIVKMYYFDICQSNNGDTKYYQSTIYLFNLWRDEKEKQDKKISETRRKLTRYTNQNEI